MPAAMKYCVLDCGNADLQVAAAYRVVVKKALALLAASSSIEAQAVAPKKKCRPPLQDATNLERIAYVVLMCR